MQVTLYSHDGTSVVSDHVIMRCHGGCESHYGHTHWSNSKKRGKRFFYKERRTDYSQVTQKVFVTRKLALDVQNFVYVNQCYPRNVRLLICCISGFCRTQPFSRTQHPKMLPTSGLHVRPSVRQQTRVKLCKLFPANYLLAHRSDVIGHS